MGVVHEKRREGSGRWVARDAERGPRTAPETFLPFRATVLPGMPLARGGYPPLTARFARRILRVPAFVAHSSRGPGRRPLTAVTRVRIPYALPTFSHVVLQESDACRLTCAEPRFGRDFLRSEDPGTSPAQKRLLSRFVFTPRHHSVISQRGRFFRHQSTMTQRGPRGAAVLDALLVSASPAPAAANDSPLPPQPIGSVAV